MEGVDGHGWRVSWRRLAIAAAFAQFCCCACVDVGHCVPLYGGLPSSSLAAWGWREFLVLWILLADSFSIAETGNKRHLQRTRKRQLPSFDLANQQSISTPNTVTNVTRPVSKQKVHFPSTRTLMRFHKVEDCDATGDKESDPYLAKHTSSR